MEAPNYIRIVFHFVLEALPRWLVEVKGAIWLLLLPSLPN